MKRIILSAVLLFAGLMATAQQKGVTSSAPAKITFVAPKPTLRVTWKAPIASHSEQNTPNLKVAFLIEGADSTTQHQIWQNGQPVGGLKRGFRRVQNVEEDIFLIEGSNLIRVAAMRDGQLFSSEERYVTYKKIGPAGEKRVALVVANQSYPDKALKKPISDGLAVKEKFEQLGYEVIFKQDLSRENLAAALDEFKTKLKKTNVGVFYYAGHGLMLDGKNYVEHIGADITSNARIRAYCAPLDLIQEEMQEANPNGTNVVFWDACRNNPAQAVRGDVNRPGANPPQGSTVIFSTSPGKTTPDDSPFAQELIKHLDTPNLDIVELVRMIQRTMEAAGLRPIMQGLLSERFYFNQK